VAAVLGTQDGAVLELTGQTPRVIYGLANDPDSLTLSRDTSEDKLVCSGEFEAADLRIAGTSTTVADLIQELAALRQEMAAVKAFVGMMPPPASPPAAPSPQIMWNGQPLLRQNTGPLNPLTIFGALWCEGSIYYTNSLPSSILDEFPMLGTSDINTADDNTLMLPGSAIVYMIRATWWRSVPLDGWTLISTGNYISSRPDITACGYSNLELYSKDYSAGTYVIDNNSALYLFKLL
jgi:hypothetical protein